MIRTRKQSLQLTVRLGLSLVVVHFFRYSISLCFFWSSFLDYFVLSLFDFVVLGLVSSILCPDIGWEERL